MPATMNTTRASKRKRAPVKYFESGSEGEGDDGESVEVYSEDEVCTSQKL